MNLRLYFQQPEEEEKRDQELIKAAQAKQQARIKRMALQQRERDAASDPSIAGGPPGSIGSDPLDEVELMLSMPEGYGGISQRQRGMTRRAAGDGPLAGTTAIQDRQEDESEDDLVMLDAEEEEVEEEEAGDSRQQESVDDDGPNQIPRKDM